MHLFHFLIFTGVVVLCESSCRSGETCIPYHQCNTLERDGIVFSCGKMGRNVCCPPPKPTRSPPTHRNTTPKPKVTNPELNKRLLPLNDCGQFSENKIINGIEANLGQFPWMALIGFKSNTTSTKTDYLCGGTLINYRYVLTAAHCVTNIKVGPPVSVRLGELDLSQDPDCTDDYCADSIVDVDVERVIVHTRYNTPYLKNDIALLRLKVNVSQSLYVVPICLPFNLNITGNEEKKYTAAGWGKTEYRNVNGSDALLFARIVSSPIADCNEAQVEEVKPIDHTQLCAGGVGGYDACKGDSGGPLMDIQPDSDGSTRTYQVGIVSFGTTPCGAENIPSVYTRVNSYLTWILSNIEA